MINNWLKLSSIFAKFINVLAEENNEQENKENKQNSEENDKIEELKKNIQDIKRNINIIKKDVKENNNDINFLDGDLNNSIIQTAKKRINIEARRQIYDTLDVIAEKIEPYDKKLAIELDKLSDILADYL